MRTGLYKQQKQIFVGYWAFNLKKPLALPLQNESMELTVQDHT